MWKPPWVTWNVICWFACFVVNRLGFYPSWRSKFLFLDIYLNSFWTLLNIWNVLRGHLVILRRVLIDRKTGRILHRNLILWMRRRKLLHLMHWLSRIHPIIWRCCGYRHHVWNLSWHVHSLDLLRLLNFRTIFFIRIFNLFFYCWHHWFVDLYNYCNIKLFAFKRFLTYFVQSILCLFFRIELDNNDSLRP